MYLNRYKNNNPCKKNIFLKNWKRCCGKGGMGWWMLHSLFIAPPKHKVLSSTYVIYNMTLFIRGEIEDYMSNNVNKH